MNSTPAILGFYKHPVGAFLSGVELQGVIGPQEMTAEQLGQDRHRWTSVSSTRIYVKRKRLSTVRVQVKYSTGTSPLYREPALRGYIADIQMAFTNEMIRLKYEQVPGL